MDTDTQTHTIAEKLDALDNMIVSLEGTASRMLAYDQSMNLSDHVYSIIEELEVEKLMLVIDEPCIEFTDPSLKSSLGMGY